MAAVADWRAFAADLLDPPEGASWQPQPKQLQASELAAQVDELLYGGAVGGGKTEWLCEYMIAQCERYAGNPVLILRRVFPSLNRTVIPRLKAKLTAGRAKWNANDHTFTFPNTSVLECGSLQYLDDIYNYQGAQYGCIAVEEVTEFQQAQVDFMIGRLRSTLPGVRPHLVATTNPGGVGHRWVKRRWIKPEAAEIEPGELPPAGGEVWRPRRTADNPTPPLRAYVPSTLEDNPALLTADPGYADRVLRNANRATRLALRYGDWDAIDAVEGALWSAVDLDAGRVRPSYVHDTVGLSRRVIAVDPSDGLAAGKSKPSGQPGDGYGVADCGLGMDGVGYVLGSWEWRASPRRMAERTVQLYHELGADAVVVERNHGGAWLVEVFRAVDPTCRVVTTWASQGKRTRAEPVAALFELVPERSPRFMARLVGLLPELEEELTSTTFDGTQPSPNRLDAMVWGLTELLIGRGVAQARASRDNRLTGRR